MSFIYFTQISNNLMWINRPLHLKDCKIMIVIFCDELIKYKDILDGTTNLPRIDKLRKLELVK